jgi:valyl-tRNA synthetase
MVGKNVRLPLIGREIPIVADSEVDSAFGTGAVKVTPAHDFDDFEIGRRHNLEQISVMDTRAHMNANAGPYAGMDRETARKRIIADLKSAGLYEREEKHTNNIGTCSRCDTVVEPMLSEQWFLNVKSMAEKAIAAVRDGRTKFFPKFWENTFFNWMENIHDWCISRQLWWGHRIPAYRCQRCDHLMVTSVRPPKCEECEGTDLKQEDDVLDTWFSSGLWPFSTLGWPATTRDLERYYPTSLLVTGFDIIFFWVARMMMFGLEFTGEVPFRDIYITPLVRDAEGKKMSKSKGNVVDPLELMDTYGTDALRFTLAQLAIQGRDVILSPDRLNASRAFANKVWNAARFTMGNLEGAPQPIPKVDASQMSLTDRWILDRLNDAIREVTTAIDRYEFNVAAMKVYDFIWHEFCDWYIELSKDALKAGGERQAAARYVIIHGFDQMLRLLHPFMPFVSEEIWSVIRPYIDKADLAPNLPIAKFPTARDEHALSEAEALAMQHCIEVTERVNSVRALAGIHPGTRVEVQIRPRRPDRPVAAGLTDDEEEDFREEFSTWQGYLKLLGKVDQVTVLESTENSPNVAAPFVLSWCMGFVLLENKSELDALIGRLEKQREETKHFIYVHENRENDPNFISRASEETKSANSAKLQELHSKMGSLNVILLNLGR